MSSPRAFLQQIARQAMRDRSFEPDFSPAALAQVARLSPATLSDERRDLRDLLWCSIDNDDSRDLDQLSVCQPATGGDVKVLVAVANVDALVKRDTPVDRHAAHNTTSVYTGAQIFPMLPERLSTDLTSLNEREDRAAVVVEYVVARDGSIGASDVYQAVVHNHAKLAYPSLGAWLEGKGPIPPKVTAVPGLESNLRQQDAAAQALKRRRHELGALTLETIEARPVFEDDTLRDLAEQQKNRAKELIEDFMIAANGVTARYLESEGLPSLRRVLPVPRRWDRIVALAAELGERLPIRPDPVALDAFLTKQRQSDPAHFQDISLSVVKLLGSGEYAPKIPGQATEGHFGLATRDYTHSTAPNRRFPDLVTQRLLKAALTERSSPYTNDELGVLARHCTEQEDNAAKVERQVAKSAAAMLLSARVGARFDAIVTGASDKGTWVRITGPTTEGRVVRGSEGLDVGDRVRVQLVRTDVARGFIDFAAVERKR